MKPLGIGIMLTLVGLGAAAAADTPPSSVIATVGTSNITYTDANIEPPASTSPIAAVQGDAGANDPYADPAHADQEARLKRTIMKVVTEGVRQELGVGVTMDDMTQVEVAETKGLGDLDWTVRQIHDHAQQVAACLAGFEAVYDRGEQPDDAFEKYVRGKAPRETWDTMLPEARLQSQRNEMAKQVSDDLALTVAALTDPNKYRNVALSRNTEIAVLREIGHSNAAARAFVASIKPPTGIADVLPIMPYGVEKVYDAWWRSQYASAGIVVLDTRFQDIYTDLSIPVPSTPMQAPSMPAVAAKPAARPKPIVVASKRAPSLSKPVEPTKRVPLTPATVAANPPAAPHNVAPVNEALPTAYAVSPKNGPPGHATGPGQQSTDDQSPADTFPHHVIPPVEDTAAFARNAQVLPPGSAQVASAKVDSNAPGAPKVAPGRMATPVPASVEFRWMQDVATNTTPLGRYAILTPAMTGRRDYLFKDLQLKITVREPEEILRDFKPLMENTQRKPDLLKYQVPFVFTAAKGPAVLFLTADQMTEANSLEREMLDYNNIIDSSPTILERADIDGAEIDEQEDTSRCHVAFDLNSDGCMKYEAFTEHHIGAVIGVFVNHKLVTAATVADQNTGYQIELAKVFDGPAQASNFVALVNGHY